ncbi:MAG: glutamate racemase [Bacteroidales bacterium]|nr:glutamate racemase [Bacteroidales bacterium]
MSPIGVFDSGYGGLTVLREIRQLMPEYDYLYLGDNARAPYGPRSFERVYEFTSEAVRRLFEMGCPLVILACNTASAKALRTIQQHDLPQLFPPTDAQPDGLPSRRVLGVIRPTVEAVGELTHSRHVGIVATQGTIASQTYELEMAKLHPDISVTGQACPMWVPLVENYEFDSPGADYFVQRDIKHLLDHDPLIDTIILGCTHFPLLYHKIRAYTPRHIQLISQGEYVARSLHDYFSRHSDLAARVSRGASARFLTTEQSSNFSPAATLFLGQAVEAEHITFGN